MADAARPSPWAPFRHAAFTSLWFAQLGSNLGTWMQSVGAQWFLVEKSHSPALVAWVQTAGQLPVLLLSLVAGVMADGLNRRRLLIVMNTGSAVVAAVLFVLALTGVLDATSLLGVTFALGCLSALAGPGWQAIQPELVPRDEIAAASSLGSVTVNGARVIGPAAAGAIIAAAGPAPVFALNAVSFLGVVVALVLWKENRRGSELSREPFGEAAASGLRYVRAAPGVRRILLRSGLFALPASAFWALLPVVASGRLRLGASGYGLLLGALGVGSVLGVLATPWMRRRLTSSTALALSALVFAGGTLAVALGPLPLVVVLLVLTGTAWIATLTTLNATLQLTVASWVRARALGAYNMVFLGSQGISAFVWGVVAQQTSPQLALIIASVLMLATAISVRWVPLRSASGTLDRRTVPLTSEGPAVAFPAPSPDATTTISTRYHVPEGDHPRFALAMRRVELSRRRTGAYLWRLEASAATQDEYREEYTVRSTAELQRALAERNTAYDQQVLQAVAQWRTDQAEWFTVTLPRRPPPPRKAIPPPRSPSTPPTLSDRDRSPAPPA